MIKKLLITLAALYITISAFAQTPGSTFENPLPVTLPLSEYTGNTSLYGNNYAADWVSPAFSYLGGDDMVLQFTLNEDSYLSGTLASVDYTNWIGMCVVNQAPDLANPAPILASASSSGSSATMEPTLLAAGTYALIVSIWPTPESPQAMLFTLDLSATDISDYIISTFPWTEDFGTANSDWPAQYWAQTSGLYPTSSGTVSQWVRDEWLNGPVGNNAAKIRIYGTSRHGWLVTPPIAIPATGHELMFNLGLTRYSATTAVDPGQQLDDKFIVAISDSPDMSNPILMREWNNSGSEYVFNEISNLGTMVILDLNDYAGTHYIAFYGESTAAGGDNDLFVDNITIRETSTAPIISINPEAWDFGTQFINTTHPKDITITNIGLGSLDISSLSVTGDGFELAEQYAPVSLLAGESADFTANFVPQAAGQLTGNFVINDNRAISNVPLSGICFDPTVYTIPWVEGFEEDNIDDTPVFGWIQESISGAQEWTANSSQSSYNRTPRTGNWNAILRYSNTQWMFRPVQLEAGVNYRTIVWARQNTTTAANATLGISYGNEPGAASMTQTILAPTGLISGDYQRLAGDFSPATSGTYYLGILGTLTNTPWYISIDDIRIELIADDDLAATAISGNLTPSVDQASDYTVSVHNFGTASQSNYTVKLYDSNDVELASAAGTTVDPGTTASIVVSWIPTTQGPMSIYGKVILAGDVNPDNDTSDLLLLNVYPAGMFTVTIGDGSETARIPLDFYYRSSIYQNIYTATEIGAVGNITSIALYNQFTTPSIMNTPVKIWMGLTDRQDLNDGWIPSTEMVLVYDGTLNFFSGENTITIPLQTPFAYPGGNLAVMFNRPLNTSSYSSSDYFKARTGTPGRARNQYSDSISYDPANLTGGTVTGIFPKTTLFMTPMSGDPVFMVNPESHDFGDTVLGGNRSRNFTIFNVGGGTLGINDISVAGSPTMVLSNLPSLPAALENAETVTFTVTYTPNSLGEHTAVITITDDQDNRHEIGGISNLRSAGNRNTHIVQITGTSMDDLTIGDGNQVARVPIDFWYKNSLFETIYTADEMSNFGGMITGLKLYNQFSSNIMATPINIWLGSTSQTNLSAGWIPSTQLTQVFVGTVDFPSDQNVISIDFQEPYLHLGDGNLVMMVHRPLQTESHSTTDYFKAQTRGLNRVRKLESNSIEYDPANPTGGFMSGQFPKTTFILIPGYAGHITGTVLAADASPLPGIQVHVGIRDYTTVTDAQGEFIIPYVLPNDYAVTFSRHGYVTQIINIVLEEEETEVINITMNLMDQVAVTGTILASDTGNGIVGASINLVGYENYSGTSDDNGNFTIPTVFANHSYDYTISATGYISASGTIDVAGSDHNMGNINLSEIAYAPNTVEAELNAAFNAANLSWNSPDPNAIEITEGFEAATFPPDEWSQIITNTGTVNPVGVLPTWCGLDAILLGDGSYVTPTEGSRQAGLWWVTSHQDEWLLTPSFSCPPDAYLSFDTYATLGSPQGDHYYVKISSDGGNSWTILWDASTEAEGTNHYEYPVTVDFAAYAGMEVKLAFHAEDPPANNGLWYEWLIDNIYIGNFVEAIRFTGSELTATKTTRSISNARSGNTPNRSIRAGNLPNRNSVHSELSSPGRSTNRVLTGYKVWRLTVGQENNEPSWTALTDEMITNLSYEDEGWTTIPNGTYKWAVKAVYTASVMSAPAFSNPLVKEVVNGSIVGFVRKQNGQGITGATVTAEGGYSSTTNNSGAYSLRVPVGIYSVTAAHAGFDSLSYEDITVAPNQNTTLNFTLVPVSNEDELVPVTVTALGGNYPNPFNPETTISYELKDAASVRLNVYNIRGQLVRSLVNSDQASGRYRVAFNACDDKGNPLSSGIYLYSFTAGKYRSTRKMMLME